MEKIRDWWHDYWLITLVGVGIAGFMWWQGRTPSQALAPVPESSSVTISMTSSAVSRSASSSAKAGYVHLKGAVARPGIYPVTGTTRWAAVVELAGGLTAEADVAAVNLAAIAEDQASLLIPKIGEMASTPSTAANAGSSVSASSALIDLNQATEADLQTLSGIGPAKATAIIAYRDEHGGFSTIDELKEVSGIGEKTFERLAPMVTVGP